jgi:hypothetical protein
MALVSNPRVAPTTITGARGPENLASGRLVPDVKNELIYLVNQNAPLTVLSDAKDGKGAQECSQYQFLFGEVDQMPPDIEINASHTGGDTALTLTSGHNKRVTKNKIYRNPATGELLRCTTEPDTSTAVATFSRAFASSSGAPAATSLSAGDKLFFVGYGFADGATKARIVSPQEVMLSGYTQIFRTPIGVTGRNKNSRVYFGGDLEQQKMQGKREHLRAIDVTGFYGVKHSVADSDTGHLITTSDGLANRIKSKTATFDETNLNYELFVDIAKEAMKDGNSGYYNGGTRTKYLFAGMSFQARMDKVFHPQVFYEPDVSIPGLQLRGIKTTAGTIMFVYTPVLDDMEWQASNKTWYDAFIVDMSHVMLRYHKGRDTQLLADRQDPSEDATIMEYFSDKGWQIENESAHMRLTFSR